MEDNKLIAEFMGRTDLLECNFEMDDRNKYYHNSWDWLMPVVQKCYKIDNEEGFNNLVDAISTLDIKATYKAVIEFIKVAEIKYNNEENHEMLQLIKKMEELEQSIINVNAKYKIKYDEIMLIIEQNILNFK